MKITESRLRRVIREELRDYMHGKLIDGVYYQSFEYKCKTPCTG